MVHGLSYALPRAVLVLIGLGASYFILTALSPQLPAAVIYMTGVAWVMAGIVCFGYLYRLRRDLGLLPHQLRAAAAALAAEAPRSSAPSQPAKQARPRR